MDRPHGRPRRTLRRHLAPPRRHRPGNLSTGHHTSDSRTPPRPIVPAQTPATATDEGLAYLALRRSSDEPSRWEPGSAACGLDRADLTSRFLRQLTAWDRDRQVRPTIAAWPTATPAPDGGYGMDIVRPHTTFRVGYGPATAE